MADSCQPVKSNPYRLDVCPCFFIGRRSGLTFSLAVTQMFKRKVSQKVSQKIQERSAKFSLRARLRALPPTGLLCWDLAPTWVISPVGLCVSEPICSDVGTLDMMSRVQPISSTVGH